MNNHRSFSGKAITIMAGSIIAGAVIWYGLSYPHTLANVWAFITALSSSSSQSTPQSNTTHSSSLTDTDKTGLEVVHANESSDEIDAQTILNALQNSTIIAAGLNLGTGTVTASNVLYAVKAGEGIAVCQVPSNLDSMSLSKIDRGHFEN